MTEENQRHRVKLVVVGDGAVGKTSLLYALTHGKFEEEYIPTVFENYAIDLKVDGKDVFLGLWDTAGQEEYDRLRPLSYLNTDIFLVCFNTVAPNKFNNVQHKWAPELELHAPDAVRILIGMQSDLRDDCMMFPPYLTASGQEPIHDVEGFRMAREIGAFSYISSSALTQENVKLLFDCAVRAALIAQEEQADPEKKEKSLQNLARSTLSQVVEERNTKIEENLEIKEYLYNETLFGSKITDILLQYYNLTKSDEALPEDLVSEGGAEDDKCSVQ